MARDRRYRSPRYRGRWLADTGCGHDLIGARVANSCGLPVVVGRPPPSFDTAGGPAQAQAQVRVRIDSIGETAEPWVLEDCPPVASIGRRCQNNGFSFIWPAGKSPYFITPHSKIVDLTVERGIPYITSDARPRVPGACERELVDCLRSASRRSSVVASCIDAADMDTLLNDPLGNLLTTEGSDLVYPAAENVSHPVEQREPLTEDNNYIAPGAPITEYDEDDTAGVERGSTPECANHESTRPGEMTCASDVEGTLHNHPTPAMRDSDLECDIHGTERSRTWDCASDMEGTSIPDLAPDLSHDTSPGSAGRRVRFDDDATVFIHPSDLVGADTIEDDCTAEISESDVDVDGESRGIPWQHFLTHLPKRRDCEACSRGKMRSPRKFRGAFRNEAAYWGHHVTADHVSLCLADSSITSDTYAFVITDVWSGLAHCYPVVDKSAAETTMKIREFCGDRRIFRFYSDNSGEISAALRELNVLHQTSTPGVPENNAVIERLNQEFLR